MLPINTFLFCVQKKLRKAVQEKRTEVKGFSSSPIQSCENGGEEQPSRCDEGQGSVRSGGDNRETGRRTSG